MPPQKKKVARAFTMSSRALPRDAEKEKSQNKKNRGQMRWRLGHCLRIPGLF